MGLLITIAVLAILFLIALKLFTVKRVVVEGNELYDQKTIEDAVLNDKYSWNSLYVYLKYKVKDTKKIPFIDTMSISLDSPHTLHISVYEKGMLGYIYIPGINENAYFDKDGFVVETSSDTVPGVPCIDGISCDKVVLYEKLPIIDRFRCGLLRDRMDGADVDQPPSAEFPAQVDDVLRALHVDGIESLIRL